MYMYNSKTMYFKHVNLTIFNFNFSSFCLQRSQGSDRGSSSSSGSGSSFIGREGDRVSAVLNELQNLASNNSLHPSSNIDMENPSSARSTNKRSHDASQDTPTKRQVLISSSTAINQQQGSGGSSDVMIKRERNEPAYEDVGYSLEDDQAWSLPTNHHQSRSMSDTSSATSTVHSSSTAAAHSNNNKPKSTTSSSHKSTIKAMTNQHEPIMPATHIPPIELIGAAVSSSFYQPIVNATSTAPAATTSTATIANNAASLAAAASTVASSTTTSLPPASSKSKSQGNGNSQANSSRGRAIGYLLISTN
jgi:hypothetical protein